LLKDSFYANNKDNKREVFMWSRKFVKTYETWDYVNPKNPEESGLVRIFARAWFNDDIFEYVEILRLKCMDTKRFLQKEGMSDGDMGRIMSLLEATALSEAASWSSEERLQNIERHVEWVVDEAKGYE
jgi:hypothetical protein